MSRSISLPGVEFLAPIPDSYAEILTPEAVAFVVDLQRAFNKRRKDLLAARQERQKRIDAGEKPNFLAESKSVREAEWTVAPLPADILDRRVEITGPDDHQRA
jgi:malate synthase